MRKLTCLGDAPGALGYRLQRAEVIGRPAALQFLQHALAVHMDMGISRQGKHGGRIGIGVGEADGSIQSARPNRSKYRKGLASDAIIALGQVYPAGLVQHLQGGYLARPQPERVGQRQVAMAWDARNIRTALVYEVLDNDLGAGK